MSESGIARSARATLPADSPARAVRAARWVAAAACAWFFAAGLAFIPRIGIQNDEALFGAGLYNPILIEHRIHIFKHTVPTMLMTYIGALKIWLYAAIFRLWPPSAYSLRVPVLLIGTVTVWLAFLVVRRAAGTRAALFTTALLATDATYLLTVTFDWGPVALQHLLLLSGVLLVTRFHDTGRRVFLGLGFLSFGLALWDKALFCWAFAGLAAAALVTVPRVLRLHLTRHNLTIAVVAFALGAAPLIRYNASRWLATFRQNTRFSTAEFGTKAHMFRLCLEGAPLFGYLVPESTEQPPPRTQRAVDHVSLAFHAFTGDHWSGWDSVAFLAAIVLLPFAGRARRAALFALVFTAVAWLWMALTKDAGGTAHHAILLWPFPLMLIGIVFAGVAARLRWPGAAALVLLALLLAGANALVINQHLVCTITGGTTNVWTDAIVQLERFLAGAPGKTIYVLDWGMFDSLRLLGRGKLDLRFESDLFLSSTMSQMEREITGRMLADPSGVFVRHTQGRDVFTGVRPRFQSAAAAAGYREEQLAIIPDGLGRPVFEVFLLARASRDR